MSPKTKNNHWGLMSAFIEGFHFPSTQERSHDNRFKSNKQKRSLKSAKSRYIGKPAGLIQERVQAVGPTHFGIISVDCVKRRSKWMLCDFYGKVLIEPTTVEHNAGSLKAMIDQLKGACQELGIKDSIAAVEMTGIYHRPVQAALRKADFDTRTVHPFASKHYRKPLHPDIKTDDNDLEAIFHTAVNGCGLSILPVDDTTSHCKRPRDIDVIWLSNARDCRSRFVL